MGPGVMEPKLDVEFLVEGPWEGVLARDLYTERNPSVTGLV